MTLPDFIIFVIWSLILFLSLILKKVSEVDLVLPTISIYSYLPSINPASPVVYWFLSYFRINFFLADVFILYSLKTPVQQSFSADFIGSKMRTLSEMSKQAFQSTPCISFYTDINSYWFFSRCIYFRYFYWYTLTSSQVSDGELSSRLFCALDLFGSQWP